jgi:hypothetical protein
MAEHSDLFRQCLEACDVKATRGLWQHVRPNMPCPETDHEVLICIHMARTAIFSIPFKLRAYSHRWLLDHGLPSQLPDQLKPKAERLYPRIAEAVGIAVKTQSEFLRPLLVPVRDAMEQAVLECYADGNTDPAFVKKRIQEARRAEYKRLLGRHRLRT